jgi:hypothetical protein
VGGGRCWGKRGRRVNTVQRICIHVYKCQN